MAVPRATYVAVVFLAVFYALSAALIIHGLGVEGALAIAADPDSAQFLTSIAADTFLGTWGANAMLVLVVTSFVACLISSVLDGTTIIGIVIGAVAVTGRDPYFGMAVWSYAAGVTGLVLVQAMAAFSVVGFFLRDGERVRQRHHHRPRHLQRAGCLAFRQRRPTWKGTHGQ